MTDRARRYLAAIVDHDWEQLAGLVSPDVVRIGPAGNDTFTGREPYVAYLAGIMPALDGYAMDITRITDTGPVSIVELTETVTMKGATLVTHEVLVLTYGSDGLLEHVSIFTQKTSTPP